MALSPRLEFRQAQTLTLTPQLMQSIRLLQLSHLELNAFVDAELLANPLLEREESEGEAPEPAEPPADSGAYDDVVTAAEQIRSADQIADGYDTSLDNVFPDRPRQELGPEPGRVLGPDRDGRFEGGEAPDLDQFVAARPLLAEQLEAQAQLLLRTPGDRLIARYLIDGLDEAGYLTVAPDAVAALLGAEPADVEAVLLALQGCEPVGVFARDLAECLAIQLRERDRLDPLM